MANAQQVILRPRSASTPVKKESLLNALRRWDDRFVPYFLVVFVFWTVAVVESIQKVGGQTLDPRFWMSLSVLVTLYGGIKVFRLETQAHCLPPNKVGFQVSQILDRLRAKGFVSFHQISCGDSTLDHVVVGPSGVYVIETKARKVFGSRAIDYRGNNELVLGGKISDPKPLKETRAGARLIQEQLQHDLQQECRVQPLVVFGGDWWVNRPSSEVDVDVLTANDLEAYFDRQQSCLSNEEIAQICSRIEAAGKGSNA